MKSKTFESLNPNKVNPTREDFRIRRSLAKKVGGVALFGATVAGVVGIQTLTEKPTRPVEITVGYGSNDWSAAKEFLEITGNPNGDPRKVAGDMIAAELEKGISPNQIKAGSTIRINETVDEKYIGTVQEPNGDVINIKK